MATSASKNGGSEQIYTVSIAAQLAGMHAQTLRQYDGLGLVSPQRTKGGGRRYSSSDVRTLREIQSLTQDQGVNLAGVALVLDLREQITQLRDELTQLGEALARSSAPTSRVFTADASGDVRQRPPTQTAADGQVNSSDGTWVPSQDEVVGKAVVSARAALSRNRVALLHLSRAMHQHGQQTSSET